MPRDLAQPPARWEYTVVPELLDWKTLSRTTAAHEAALPLKVLGIVPDREKRTQNVPICSANSIPAF